MKARLTIAAVALAASALPMAASAVKTPIHQNPLDACNLAIANEFGREEVTDTFYKRLEDGRHVIYANVEVRGQDGSTDYQRVTCETSRSGRVVQELEAVAGRWVEPDQG